MSDPTMLRTQFQESPNNYGHVTPKEIRVSLDEVTSEPRRSNATARSSSFGRSGEHVVVCSPNSHFKLKSSLMRMKTKSRLMDEQEIHIKSPLNTPKYETQGKGFGDTEEDDISMVEDLPDEYKQLSKFFDRIQESLFNQYVIERLSGRPVIEIQKEQQEKDWMMDEVEKLQSDGANIPHQLNENVVKGFRGIGGSRPSTPLTGKKEANSPPKKHDDGITIDHLHKFNQKNISAWNMNRMMNVINTSMLTISDEKFLDMKGYGYGDGDIDDDENSKQIKSENQAKYAAQKIFFNVAQQGSKYIYLEDLKRFLRDVEALRTTRLFHEASATKGISKRDLEQWVVNVFRERRALALSLNDTKTAVDKLHQMLNIVVAIIIVIFWLLILKLATTHFFIFLSSQLILVAFVFGNTCKTLFEATIFLFVMHPFDVGDRCEIDGVQMIVEEMNILTTTFLRNDNQKIAYPNSVLSTMPIGNYQRSPDMGDAIDFCIHVSTPAEKIANMKERITRYIENKSDHWQPEPMIVVRDVEDMNRLKLSIWLSHRSNFQDMGGRWERRALLVEKMIKILKDLDIEYRMLPLDINVRNIVPSLSSNRLPSNWTVCAN